MQQETSLQAYFGEVIQTLGDRQKAVLAAFTQKENFTNSELASFLHWQINTVTPRVFELRAKKLVIEEKKRPCKVTGRTAIAWKLKPKDPVQARMPIFV